MHFKYVNRIVYIPCMNNIDLDFKLLQVFQGIMVHGQVSKAADQLGWSQPAVSRGLARLREYFSDPLFVRTRRAMEPTPCALEVAPAVSDLLTLYHTQLSRKAKFDPATSRRRFRIAASEVGHMVLLPRLLAELANGTSDISVEALSLGLRSRISQLETGDADLAFGSYPKLYAGVHERTLYTEQYVCLVRRDHPTIRGKLDKAGYERARHIIVSAEGLGHIHEQIEKRLLDLCPRENVRVVAHSFFVTALLVERSDFIATVPSKVAEALGPHHQLRVIQPTIKLPSFRAKLYWHERFHRDPANKWLRQLIAGFFR